LFLCGHKRYLRQYDLFFWVCQYRDCLYFVATGIYLVLSELNNNALGVTPPRTLKCFGKPMAYKSIEIRVLRGKE